MTDYIQVSTEVLKEKEGEWLGVCSRIQSSFQGGMAELKKMEQIFRARPLLEVWQIADGLLTEGEQVLAGLSRHIGKLSEIAVIYETAERENQNVFNKN